MCNTLEVLGRARLERVLAAPRLDREAVPFWVTRVEDSEAGGRLADLRHLDACAGEPLALGLGVADEEGGIGLAAARLALLARMQGQRARARAKRRPALALEVELEAERVPVEADRPLHVPHVEDDLDQFHAGILRS